MPRFLRPTNCSANRAVSQIGFPVPESIRFSNFPRTAAAGSDGSYRFSIAFTARKNHSNPALLPSLAVSSYTSCGAPSCNPSEPA